MKGSLCVRAAFAALAMGTAAWAQTEAGDSAEPVAAPSAPAAPAPPRASRPVAPFAAGSVAGATRLTPERKLELRFIKEQAAGSRFEMEASKLALNRSNRPAVRALAASLINHNGIVGLELLHLLHARGMAAPMLGDDRRKTLNRLSRLSGSRFDKSYMEEMVGKQHDDLREFDKASVALHEPQLRAWVDRMLPALQYHQMLAQRAGPRAAGLRPVGTRLSGSSTP